MEDRFAELESRLGRAERRVRLMFVLAMAAVVAAVTLAGARPAMTLVQGQKVQAPFQVVDANGRTMFEVASDNDGPFFRLLNRAGKQVAMIYSDADGGNALLHTAQGALVSSWFCDNDGGNLTLRDRNDKILVELTTTTAGGQIILRDKAANEVFRRP